MFALAWQNERTKLKTNIGLYIKLYYKENRGLITSKQTENLGSYKTGFLLLPLVFRKTDNSYYCITKKKKKHEHCFFFFFNYWTGKRFLNRNKN